MKEGKSINKNKHFEMPKRKRSVDTSEYSSQIKTFVNKKVISEKSSSSEELMSMVYGEYFYLDECDSDNKLYHFVYEL